MQTTRRITIFDTTLRDGEQSVGVAFSPEDKVEIALALEQLGVDVIEAGFPAASDGELQAVAAVAAAVRGPIIAAMARATQGDVEAAAEALASARRSRLHLVLGTSDIHREHKLRLRHDELITLATRLTGYASALFDEVEFCCEDASRSDPAFLQEVCAAVVDAGADILNLPDTVGRALPTEYGLLFRTIESPVPLSAHCHDDLGLATANSLAAVLAGAAQIECTINGIGERAGNAALEEVATALELRDYTTGIDLNRLADVSQLVCDRTGYPVAPHKAIVGENARRNSLT